MNARAIIAALALPLGTVATPPTARHQLVLTHATVVDVRAGRLLPDRTIVIDGGRISAIVSASDGAPPGEQSVDLKGAFVTPGFSDMHVHVQETANPPATLQLMLASGITSYRLMSGSPDLLDQRRRGVLFPWPDKPDLLAMPGAILMPPNAGTPAKAVAEVDKQAAEGADFIKVIQTPPDSFFAGLAEAKAHRLTYIGHLPALVDVWKASNEGMREIEHVGPNAELVAGCSPRAAALTRERIEVRAQEAKAPAPKPDPSLRAMPGNPVLLSERSDLAFMRGVVDSFDDAQCRKLAATFVRNQTWQTPTLIRLYTMEFGTDPELAADPNLVNITAADRAHWNALTEAYRSKFSAADQETLHRLYAVQLRTVKIFDEEGVPMLTGSDMGGAGWVVPGLALRKEFARLAEAGLSPATILRMTTLNPARLLGRETEFGAVEPGRVANLVVLNADPLQSAANLSAVEDVILHGRLYGAVDLERLKTQSTVEIQSSPPHAPPAGE